MIMPPLVSPNPFYAVVDADGKIAGWYLVQPENVERIPALPDHKMVEITRKPALDETHVNPVTGEPEKR